MTQNIIETILSNYRSESLGVQTNLVRLLNWGGLSRSGRFIIYSPDQGFEHGPGRSFAQYPNTYNPSDHFELAIAGGFSAIAAPIGLLEAGYPDFIGRIPLILKLNHGIALSDPNTLSPNQAMVASVQDAVRLGCIGVGMTLYPGSFSFLSMLEGIAPIIKKAKEAGLLVIIWSYARGGILSKDGETALDIVAYGAHMAVLAGAHIVKVKIPTMHLETEEAKKLYPTTVPMTSLVERIRHVVDSTFMGKRLVAFSGGDVKDHDALCQEAKAVVQGGGAGSIIARNCYKRDRTEAIALIHDLIKIYADLG